MMIEGERTVRMTKIVISGKKALTNVKFKKICSTVSNTTFSGRIHEKSSSKANYSKRTRCRQLKLFLWYGYTLGCLQEYWFTSGAF